MVCEKRIFKLIYLSFSPSDELMNLDDFISMAPKIGEGVVKDLQGFAEYFGAPPKS